MNVFVLLMTTMSIAWYRIDWFLYSWLKVNFLIGSYFAMVSVFKLKKKSSNGLSDQVLE